MGGCKHLFTRESSKLTVFKCEMRPSHASSKYLAGAPELPKDIKKEKWSSEFRVKGRNEPCAISKVAYAIANIKGIPVEQVCKA